MTSPLVDEAMQLGATPVAADMLETQRWAMPPDLAYCFVEYSGVNLDLKAIMQRHSNIIAAQRKVNEANALPSHLPPPHAQAAPQQPPAAAQRPPAPNVAPSPPQQALFCAEHLTPVQLSQAKYQKYDELPDGTSVPARYYHKLAPEDQYQNEDGQTVSNHSLWRRDVVDAEGTPIA